MTGTEVSEAESAPAEHAGEPADGAADLGYSMSGGLVAGLGALDLTKAATLGLAYRDKFGSGAMQNGFKADVRF